MEMFRCYALDGRGGSLLPNISKRPIRPMPLKPAGSLLQGLRGVVTATGWKFGRVKPRFSPLCPHPIPTVYVMAVLAENLGKRPARKVNDPYAVVPA